MRFLFTHCTGDGISTGFTTRVRNSQTVSTRVRDSQTEGMPSVTFVLYVKELAELNCLNLYQEEESKL